MPRLAFRRSSAVIQLGESEFVNSGHAGSQEARTLLMLRVGAKQMHKEEHRSVMLWEIGARCRLTLENCFGRSFGASQFVGLYYPSRQRITRTSFSEAESKRGILDGSPPIINKQYKPGPLNISSLSSFQARHSFKVLILLWQQVVPPKIHT